jgi:hypothetical protein
MSRAHGKFETAQGRCSQHGRVQGVRDKPRPSFPFILYLIRRQLASRAPFTCPECGEAIARG